MPFGLYSLWAAWDGHTLAQAASQGGSPADSVCAPLPWASFCVHTCVSTSQVAASAAVQRDQLVQLHGGAHQQEGSSQGREQAVGRWTSMLAGAAGALRAEACEGVRGARWPALNTTSAHVITTKRTVCLCCAGSPVRDACSAGGCMRACLCGRMSHGRRCHLLAANSSATNLSLWLLWKCPRCSVVQCGVMHQRR